MISEIFPEEQRRLSELEAQLSILDNAQNSSSLRPGDVYAGLTDMEFRLHELDKLADNENKARRSDYKRRVQHLRNIHLHIKQTLNRIVKRRFPEYEQSRRDQLFSGADLEGGGYNKTAVDTSQSLDRSSSMVNDYIEIGQHTLSELINQKERLKVMVDYIHMLLLFLYTILINLLYRTTIMLYIIL